MGNFYDDILESVRRFIKENGGVDAIIEKELLPGSRPTIFRATQNGKLPGAELLCQWVDIIGCSPARISTLTPHGQTGTGFVLATGDTPPDGVGAVVPVYQFIAGGEPIEWTEAEPICEVCIPKSFLFPGLMVVQVVGDSMHPLIKDGAYVGINKHANKLVPGKVYAVSVPYEGLTLKRVFLDADNAKLVLKPENPTHPTQHVAIEDREGLIVGQVIWGMQNI